LIESKFIEENKADWKALEKLLEKEYIDADQLHRLFVKVSSDLSYAKTFYPNRSVRIYLNKLTQQVFDSMLIKKEKLSFKYFTDFFKHSLPREIIRSKNAFVISTITFLIAMTIGMISSKYDPDFSTSILGADYVNMTKENIAAGDPMKVYKDGSEFSMFIGITLNNIKVALMTFVFGILGSIGTFFILLFNGIMVGTFQYLFYENQLFVESFLTIWIHGTIEISSIIVAGAAGLILGNSLFFPKTFRRSDSLQIAAVRALKIIGSTIPLFVVAGLLESFVTRHTGWPDFVRAGIILFSALFILTMYVFYPWYYYKSGQYAEAGIDIKTLRNSAVDNRTQKFLYFTDILRISLSKFRSTIANNIKHFLLPFSLFILFGIWYSISISGVEEIIAGHIPSILNRPIIFILMVLGISFQLIMLARHDELDEGQSISTLSAIKTYLPKVLLLLGIYCLPLYFIPSSYKILYLLAIPLQIPYSIFKNILQRAPINQKVIGASFQNAYKDWMKFLPVLGISLGLYYIITAIAEIGIGRIIGEFLSWHGFFSDQFNNQVLANNYLVWILLSLFVPLLYFLFKIQDQSNSAYRNASDLRSEFNKFGNFSNVFEQHD